MSVPPLAAVIVHPVKDFQRWQEAFDSHGDARAANGITGYAVNHLLGDDTNVTIYLQGKDMETLKRFSDSPDLKQAMQEAGVTGPPTMLFVNSVGGAEY